MMIYISIKYTAVLFFTILLQQANAQFLNDFETNQLPEWSGETIEFEVSDGRLNLRAPNTEGSFIYREIETQDSMEFIIDFELDFAPSGSNSLTFYLITDDPENPDEKCYYLTVGESGSDDALEFHKKDSTGDELLLRLEDGSLGNDPANAKLIIERYNTGKWIFKTSYSSDEPIFEAEYEDTDQLSFAEPFFGLLCEYTSTRRNSFHFDRLGVRKIIPDTEAPFVNGLTVNSSTEIEVFYNERMDNKSALDQANYDLSNISIADISISADSSSVMLSLSSELAEASPYDLSIYDVSDQSGNTIQDTTLQIFYYDLQPPEAYDLIITEIMAAPQAGSLPDAEFIEIYNRSDNYLNSMDLTISDPSVSGNLESGRIDPGEFVILCEEENAEAFEDYGKVLTVSPWPNLNNSSDSLLLQINNTIIHRQNYSSEWFTDSEFYSAGYSLELHNPDYLCYTGNQAWWEHGSTTKASPGTINIPWDTLIAREIEVLSTEYINSSTLRLRTSADLSSMTSGDIEVQDDLLTIENISIEANEILVEFAEEMAEGIIYTLNISMYDDCVFNFAFSQEDILFGRPNTEREKSICINEVMFDPETGDNQWIEIYNSGNDIYKLSDLNLNIIKDGIVFSHNINSKKLFLPDQYLILCESCSENSNFIGKGLDKQIINMDELENMDRESGNIEILDELRIDYISYDEEWHDPLLSDSKGVSLYRLNCASNGEEEFNWASSGFTSGYSTPGIENPGTITPNPDNSGDLFLESSSFSPDGDGFEDQLIIYNKLNIENLRFRIDIYDLEGRKVKNLINNKTIANGDFLSWDGTNNAGEEVIGGMYIITANYYNNSGVSGTWRTSCTLIK